jgi:hypothetical protein
VVGNALQLLSKKGATDSFSVLCSSVKEGRDRQLQLKQELTQTQAVEERRAMMEMSDAAVRASNEERVRGCRAQCESREFNDNFRWTRPKQARREASRVSRDAYKTGLAHQIADRAAARSSETAQPLAERLAREQDELRRKIAIEDARARMLSAAIASGVSDNALRAAGLLRVK